MIRENKIRILIFLLFAFIVFPRPSLSFSEGEYEFLRDHNISNLNDLESLCRKSIDKYQEFALLLDSGASLASAREWFENPKKSSPLSDMAYFASEERDEVFSRDETFVRAAKETMENLESEINWLKNPRKRFLAELECVEDFYPVTQAIMAEERLETETVNFVKEHYPSIYYLSLMRDAESNNWSDEEVIEKVEEWKNRPQWLKDITNTD